VIRDFVKQGGAVIADVRPGLYDDHCKPRERGVFDDLFGIRREGKPPAKRAAIGPGADASEGEKLPNLVVDPGVKIAGPSAASRAAADHVPALIVNKAGGGAAVLLNFSMSSYPKINVAETPERAATVFRDLFGLAGARPAIRVADATRRRVRNLETIRWQDGGLEIVAFWRQGGPKGKALVDLSAAGPRYVYDLRNRKALGRCERFAPTFLPNRASFFVLCPKPAPAAQVTLDPASAQRGSVVKASISVPNAAGLHAFRIRAQAGDRPLDWLDQNVVVGREAKTFDIPIAYNDPAAEYEIRAIDLLTNEATTARLAVK